MLVQSLFLQEVGTLLEELPVAKRFHNMFVFEEGKAFRGGVTKFVSLSWCFLVVVGQAVRASTTPSPTLISTQVVV